MTKSLQDGLTKLQQNIIPRLVLYYGALAFIAIVLWRSLPPGLHQQLSDAVAPLVGSVGAVAEAARRASGPSVISDSARLVSATTSGLKLAPESVLLLSTIAGVMALLLSLPISWVYMFTRQKKGYSQSVVHSLILLPVVVAMVAALVRNSIALAFSLAGVVAAVRFRTTLEDSKDAVYVFAVTALGLACGVQLEVGAVLSVLWVVIILVLWYTDYARTPPALEGARAEQHLQRAMAIANRTSQFVAKLDREILDTMAPAQLDALQGRLDKRRGELEAKKKGKTQEKTQEMEAHDDEGPRFDGRLTVTVSDPEAAQPAIEALLEAQLKRWKMVRLEQQDGQARIVYAIRARKGMTLESVAETVERDVAPYVARAEVERWA
jgi:hypothetical protein